MIDFLPRKDNRKMKTMSGKTHNYETRTVWTGNTGTGTSGYRAYDRAHEISV